jgi:hypothetical protein
VKRYFPTGMQTMTAINDGGVCLMGAIAGLLAVYSAPKFRSAADGRQDLSYFSQLDPNGPGQRLGGLISRYGHWQYFLDLPLAIIQVSSRRFTGTAALGTGHWRHWQSEQCRSLPGHPLG